MCLLDVYLDPSFHFAPLHVMLLLMMPPAAVLLSLQLVQEPDRGLRRGASGERSGGDVPVRGQGRFRRRRRRDRQRTGWGRRYGKRIIIIVFPTWHHSHRSVQRELRLPRHARRGLLEEGHRGGQEPSEGPSVCSWRLWATLSLCHMSHRLHARCRAYE